MIVLKIDVTKISKEDLFVGKKGGKFLDAALHDKPNDFGDDGFITQSVSKEKRDKGEKGPIIGNWRHVGAKQKQATPKPTAAQKSEKPADDDDQSVPF